MLIRFLRDFQSAHTGGVFYAAGTEVDLESAYALMQTDPGVAEIVTIDSRRGQAEPSADEAPAPKPRGRPRNV